MESRTFQMPLEIIIAGAGIAGLSTAIGLARRGHLVNVYERIYDNDGEDESVGAIRFQPNAVKILREWGPLEVINEYTHNGIWTDVRDHTGETLPLIAMASRGTRTGPRGDFKAALQKFDIRCGAKVQRGRQVVGFDESGSRPAAIFSDDSRASADLIIGADYWS